MALVIKKSFGQEVNGRCIATDGVTTSETCGKIFTQWPLHEHKKYSCKQLETQKRPKKEYPKCGKIVSRLTVYNHQKKGCPKFKKILKKKLNRTFRNAYMTYLYPTQALSCRKYSCTPPAAIINKFHR